MESQEENHSTYDVIVESVEGYFAGLLFGGSGSGNFGGCNFLFWVAYVPSVRPFSVPYLELFICVDEGSATFSYKEARY